MTFVAVWYGLIDNYIEQCIVSVSKYACRLFTLSQECIVGLL